MSEQIRYTPQHTPRHEQAAEVAPVTPTPDQEEVERIKRETDELLDAIDAVLEENAEDFVKSYIQKGGE